MWGFRAAAVGRVIRRTVILPGLLLMKLVPHGTFRGPSLEFLRIVVLFHFISMKSTQNRCKMGTYSDREN
jgi:hypothetical protein